ncbi:MAG: hypothetical protein WBH01_04570 [Dehalococcoidia bacterium]
MKKGKFIGKIFGIALVGLMIGAMLGGLPVLVGEAEAPPVNIHVPDDCPTIQAAMDAAGNLATSGDLLNITQPPPAYEEFSKVIPFPIWASEYKFHGHGIFKCEWEAKLECIHWTPSYHRCSWVGIKVHLLETMEVDFEVAEVVTDPYMGGISHPATWGMLSGNAKITLELQDWSPYCDSPNCEGIVSAEFAMENLEATLPIANYSSVYGFMWPEFEPEPPHIIPYHVFCFGAVDTVWMVLNRVGAPYTMTLSYIDSHGNLEICEGYGDGLYPFSGCFEYFSPIEEGVQTLVVEPVPFGPSGIHSVRSSGWKGEFYVEYYPKFEYKEIVVYGDPIPQETVQVEVRAYSDTTAFETISRKIPTFKMEVYKHVYLNGKWADPKLLGNYTVTRSAFGEECHRYPDPKVEVCEPSFWWEKNSSTPAGFFYGRMYKAKVLLYFGDPETGTIEVPRPDGGSCTRDYIKIHKLNTKPEPNEFETKPGAKMWGCIGVVKGNNWSSFIANFQEDDPIRVEVKTAPPNQPPTAYIDSITPDPAEQAKDIVSFTGHGTDSDGSVVAYNWRSSIDGQLSTSSSFTKSASELSVGTHTIYFKVRDDDGVWSTEATEDLDLVIEAANQSPYKPSNPLPSDGASGVDINADLSWSGGDPDAGDTVTYDVYFGTSSTPPFRETIGPYPATQSSITYDPGTLADNTKYYWRIVARDNHGIAREGPIWDFSTGLPGPTVTWNLPWGLDADPASVNIWTYPGDAVAVTLADVEWSMPAGLLIWYYGGPIEGWRFYKNGWGASNTLETLIAGKGYIGIVPTASVWEIPQG